MQSYFHGYMIRCSREVAYTAHNLMLNTGSINKSISNCNRTPESLSRVSNHINQSFFRIFVKFRDASRRTYHFYCGAHNIFHTIDMHIQISMMQCVVILPWNPYP